MTDKPRPDYRGAARDEDALPGRGAPLRLPSGRFSLLVSGSPVTASPQLLAWLARRAASVTAVDAGAEACRAAGVMPDTLVGDLDSVPDSTRAWCEAGGVRESLSNWDKDATDLMLAVRFAQRGWGDGGMDFLAVTSCLGGRVDHLLAAVGTLASHASLAPVLVEDDALALVLSADGPRSEVRLSDVGCVVATTVSVTALIGPATVTERGMRWDLESACLLPLSDAGTSNYVTVPDEALVRVEEGVALVTIPRLGC